MAEAPDWQRFLAEVMTATQRAARRLYEEVGRFQTSDLARGLRRLAEETAADLGPKLAAAMSEIAEATKQGLPDNWDRLTVPEIFETVDLMRQTGWSLVWVPTDDVIHALLSAKTEAERQRILLGAEPAILARLEALVDQTTHPDLSELQRASREALETYTSGYLWSAQALATAALGSVIHQQLGHQTWKDARQAVDDLDPEEAGIRLFRFSALIGALATAIERNYPGDPAPHRYNRHASAHGVDVKQYTPVNSLAALMLVACIVHELSNMRILLDAG